MRQLITPNPNIPCKPGWCLAYVNEAFGVPKLYPSATSAWFGSKTKHEDRDFPPGVWVPVWYGLDTTPLGHVVLLAPDGSVYSTSDLTNTPHHHPDLADLEAYYAYYGMKLTYRGWTEDVEGTPVLTDGGIAAMGETITPIQEDDMANVPQAEWDDAIAILRSLNRNVVTDTKLATALASVPLDVWSYKNPDLGSGDAFQILRDAVAGTDRLAETVSAAAAKAAAGGADVETIKRAAKEAITELLIKGATK